MGSEQYGTGELDDEATFCDVVLHVGNVDVPCHRAVLAAVSPHLMQLFTADDEKSLSRQQVMSYKLNGISRKAL
ncbi:hypothetical protein GE061_008689 [Apolygus lucorum]|uniref:BTB domain-containing protein n=1 Tax=Apolygus lucorum TaxID=248454 RepID=A0A8S9WLL6_APOLU|nr:hypothetical protein GE061_008689 [Apolygus lucorum]